MTTKLHLFSIQRLASALLLMAAVCLSTFSTKALAQEAAPYATLDSDGTLTFSFGTMPDSAFSLRHILADNLLVPEWYSRASEIKKVVFADSFAQARPTDCSNWFCNATSLQTITNIQNLNTEQVTNMESMFRLCRRLKTIDISHFNTQSVTNMAYMFAECENLTSLQLAFLKTQLVTNMSHLLYKCRNLTDVDLSNFSTQSVTDMSHMFYGCEKIENLDLTSFNTQKVTNMRYMFSKCNKLSAISLSSFNTQNVTDMNSMFDGCYSIEELNLQHFVTQKVTNMRYMFNKCRSLTTLDLSEFDTQCVTDMASMFAACTRLSSLNVAGFRTPKVTDMSSMFYQCSALKSIDVSGFNTQNVKSMTSMFRSCEQLASLNLSNFNTEKVQYTNSMFERCSSLSTIYVSDKFTTTAVTKSDNMFANCPALKGAIAFDGGKVTKDYANYTDGYFTKLVGKLAEDNIGATGVHLTTDTLAIKPGQDFVAYEPFHATTASYNRPVTDKWSVLCLPFAISQTEEECKFYQLASINASKASVVVESYPEGSVIPAGTPVLLKMNDGYSTLSIMANDAQITPAPLADTLHSNAHLVGTFTKIDTEKADTIFNQDSYLLASDMFHQAHAASSPQANAMSCYIQASDLGSAQPSTLTIEEDSGISTSLSHITTDADIAPIEYFDVQGHRLSAPQQGVVIVRQGTNAYKLLVK